ncbi:MAG: metallophosphoesterase [Methanobacteriota archaeon]|nr:MAG: metallophosphoesterase [Euryarchaeota archaeon]
MNAFPLTDEIGIVEGWPFLHLSRESTIVLGDIHLGHESIILGDDLTQLTPSIKILKKGLTKAISSFSVRRIIFNGDIKHLSYGVTGQERLELRFLLESLASRCELVLIKGNHDRFLKFALDNDIRSSLQIVESYEFDDILILHGDADMILRPDWKTIILSHEHPSFVFHGSIGERIKLPAFAFFRGMLEGLTRDFIILPAASALAGGVSFPPHSRNEFLSPLLKRLETPIQMSLYPFDETTGVIPLPSEVVG